MHNAKVADFHRALDLKYKIKECDGIWLTILACVH